jgi:hypothetical protein
MSDNSDDGRERAAIIRGAITPRPLDIAGATRSLDAENRRMALELNASHIFSLRISKIKIGERFRKDMGDIDALERSIQQLGLLQPIVVTMDHKLVAGERRILAARRLGWKVIPAHVIDIASMLSGEIAENVIRKDFTPSERLAIAEAVEAELGERRGRPAENVRECGQLNKGEKTEDIAAKAAGFKSADMMNRAKTVVAKGIPEVVEAMEKGEIAISTAAEVAKLPKAVQGQVAEKAKTNIKNYSRKAKESGKEPTLKGIRGAMRQAVKEVVGEPPKESRQEKRRREEQKRRDEKRAAAARELAEWIIAKADGDQGEIAKVLAWFEQSHLYVPTELDRLLREAAGGLLDGDEYGGGAP